MKVTLDVSAVPPKIAGAGRYIAALSQLLPTAVDLTLVSRRDDGERWAEWSAASVAPIVPNNRVARLAYEAVALGRHPVYRGSTVWHSPHYTMPHGGRTPTVVTIHDLTFLTNPEWHEAAKVNFFRRAIRYAAAHADVLISVSAFTAELLREVAPSDVPIVVAPHGVDHRRFAPLDDGDDQRFIEAGLDGAVAFILFVGTFEPRKGLDVLLDAFGEVAAREADVELWLAGQSGWGTEEIAAQLRSHPYAQRIRRLGYVSDELLGSLYRRARVVAYPSRGEGFGLPVLEALSCGALVVTSAKTVLEEVAGTSATLTPVGDAASLAQALCSLMELGDEERHHRAQLATAQARTFTWERSMAQHLAAYHLAAGG
jgi:glycosyltransferase involved in cell wall biosynthesis